MGCCKVDDWTWGHSEGEGPVRGSSRGQLLGFSLADWVNGSISLRSGVPREEQA